MTPTEIETRARTKYNSVGDSFFSQAEILDYIWQGCMELATEALVIEGTPQTTSTVASQQSYAFPSMAIGIKRITYDGQKLQKITFREDDSVTGLDQDTTSTGTPQYYFVWNEVIYLRPIPSAVATLRIYPYNEPNTLSSTSTLEVPSRYHMGLVDFVLKEMAAKDSNFLLAEKLEVKWEKYVQRAKAFERRKSRGDSFNSVQDEESLINGYLGVI